jgi:hypothetical protein
VEEEAIGYDAAGDRRQAETHRDGNSAESRLLGNATESQKKMPLDGILKNLKPSGNSMYHLLYHSLTPRFVHGVYLCVSYNSHNKQRLFT